MSLQIRLAAFYTALVGLVLVAFGWAVYARSSEILMRQIDVRLASAVKDAGSALRAEGRQDYLITYDSSILLQLYDLKGELVNTTSTTEIQLSSKVIDPEGLAYVLENRGSITSERNQDGLHYRTLTTPVWVGTTQVGVLQAATNLAPMDQLQADLLRSLLIIGLVIITIAASFVYYSTHSALQPLATVTRIASEITKADDLSLRIPQSQRAPDEVGALICAFNKTMGRLEHLFNSQRRFLADVGHELRTPLTVLRGNADLMRRMGQPDPLALDSMEKEIERLSRMVEDVLLMAQAESGRLELNYALVELDTVLLEVYQQARVLAGETKILHIKDIDQVLVVGDRDRLKQVILNLISNAIKYSAPNGRIQLSLGKKDGWAYLAVEDDGIGIHREDMQHIFERFYRATKSRSKFIDYDHKGFGLGLSIAYWIMLRHNGRIDVESEYGQGAKFTIWLPSADENTDIESFTALDPGEN